jgi:PIN domain nuclease of toxin-antitoxin system
MKRERNASSVNLVRLLLDTQILVWLVNGDRRLKDAVSAAIGNPATSLHVSAVIAYEYADLQKRGRIPVDEPMTELIVRFDLAIESFPADCWQRAADLPAIHRDPIDRMLVAHALHDDMTLVTADANIHKYPVKVIS